MSLIGAPLFFAYFRRSRGKRLRTGRFSGKFCAKREQRFNRKWKNWLGCSAQLESLSFFEIWQMHNQSLDQHFYAAAQRFSPVIQISSGTFRSSVVETAALSAFSNLGSLSSFLKVFLACSHSLYRCSLSPSPPASTITTLLAANPRLSALDPLLPQVGISIELATGHLIFRSTPD